MNYLQQLAKRYYNRPTLDNRIQFLEEFNQLTQVQQLFAVKKGSYISKTLVGWSAACRLELESQTDNLILEAKMCDLFTLVECLRLLPLSYQSALNHAIEFCQCNHGGVQSLEEEVTVLTVNGQEVSCFQPYPDMDKFYFEY